MHYAISTPSGPQDVYKMATSVYYLLHAFICFLESLILLGKQASTR